MAINRIPSLNDRLDEWRVSKKIKPTQRGAIKLARSYGAELLCVRYRENADGTERLTTVELLLERTVIQKREDPLVSFKIRHDEPELRGQAKALGAKYDGKNKLWKLPRSEVIRLGLRHRIAVTQDDFYREHVHP